MNKPRPCIDIESDLIAAATGEASEDARERVARHLAACAPCHDEHDRYRAVDAAIGEVRGSAPAVGDGVPARLLERLADLRSRLVRYGVFPSPLGPILIAATELGISLVEYLGRGGVAASSLLRRPGIEAEPDGAGLERFHGELIEYLDRRRERLAWPLDLKLAKSEFHRSVLRATAKVPFGAVSSYAGIAREIGRPAAVRAVAQALRNNPLPIVVPCHRIVGSGGALVGYAGSRLGLKERLLGVEGVPIDHGRREGRIDRTAMYAWDPRGREVCLPTCGGAAKRPIGEVTLLASIEEITALGLAPCGDCRPDLHPLRA